MKNLCNNIFAIAFIFILPSCNDDAKKNATPLPEQDGGPWFSYYNEDSTRIGFKDKSGVRKSTNIFFCEPKADTS